MKPQIFVGLDVSKQKLDVAVRPQGRHFVTNNNDQGMKQLVKRLVALKPQLIVLEASGGYEFLVTAALAEAQLPVAMVNPQAVRKFAGATGKLAKTDKIDAQVLAHFAEALKPEPRSLPGQDQQLLKAALQRRLQVVKMIGQEKNRLEKTLSPLSNRISRFILPGCSNAWSSWTGILTTRSAIVLSGGTRTVCYRASPASAQSLPGLSWPSCRKRARCPVKKPRPWWG